jgi:hypothetical protein
MLLNYTTKVASAKTVAQIQEILGAKGASHVGVDYLDGRATAVIFGLKIGPNAIHFRLPCSIDGVSAALKKSTPHSSIWRDRQQCERIAWRIVKDWVEAQMALVEANQAEMGEVFLPYAIHVGGETFFQRFKNQQLALGDGGNTEQETKNRD